MASSRLRAHYTVGWRGATSDAMVVPHEPAPNTATCTVPPSRAPGSLHEVPGRKYRRRRLDRSRVCLPARRWHTGLHTRRLRRQVLLLRRHLIELRAHFVQTRPHFVERIVQRLHLRGYLVHLAAHVVGLLRERPLQVLDRARDLVHVVGGLLDQVLHDAHALVEGLAHLRHLVLQAFHLGLELDHLFAHTEYRQGTEDRHRD